MCGIVGYVGTREAAPILVAALERLEYRGYDSAGIAVQNGHGLEIRKVVGRVHRLSEATRATRMEGALGIGHTRWATHGPPSERNAHPHADCTRTFALVHNGIVENADALRAQLRRTGHRFRTQTDTEALAHLIEEAPGETLEERVIFALAHVKGTYGLAVVSAFEPSKIVVARLGSPVLLGVAEREFFVASDASAVRPHTRSVVYLNDGDVAVVTQDGYQIIDRQARLRVRDVHDLEWGLEAVELGPYPHFMLKEICEQPKTIKSTLRGRLLPEAGGARLDGLNLSTEDCDSIQRIVFVACGTSWHAGLVGRHIIETLAGIPVQVEYASEYRYHPRLTLPGTLTVAISQSGETADTLEAMRAARAAGSRVIGIVNVVGSTIAREANGGIYLHAGPEIGVASTKAFTSQIIALLLLGLFLGSHRGLSRERGRDLARALLRLPALVRQTLKLQPQIQALAHLYAEARNALFLGRGVHFPVALEGALKLKEISYVHAEGYPAAEMKHGPIALIDENMPVVFVAPRDELYPKVLSNIQEVKARGGQITVVGTEGSEELNGIVDHQVCVPAAPTLLTPVLTSIPLQLLAYHAAVLRGCDVDQPRNLAKSVTVE